MMSTETKDIIDLLAGIEAGSALDGIRGKRVQARENAQKSYLTLFEPAELGDVSAAERLAVASFVAGIHGETNVAGFYLTKLADIAQSPELVAAAKAEIDRGKTSGPYGSFPAGPLSAEDKPGLTFRVAQDHQRLLGAKLAAALEHAHLLVFHPRDAAPVHMKSLLDAGWTASGVVTLSQLVAFLSFQVRVVAGLRALSASPRHQASAAAR
jgi:CMD domain protein